MGEMCRNAQVFICVVILYYYPYAFNSANQMKFVALLNPIFSDLGKLEEYVKKADRFRIDD